MSSSQKEPSPQDPGGQWFAAEVQPHTPRLKAWLRARFPWLRDIDDVVQESLLRLWRQRVAPGAMKVVSPKAMLFAIARNAAVDTARRQAVVAIESVAAIEELSVLDHVGVVETVSAREELECLADAVRSLPPRCRQVLTLTKIYGYTEREVAERLRLSEHTVRAQVVRGLARCTEYLLQRGINRDRP